MEEAFYTKLSTNLSDLTADELNILCRIQKDTIIWLDWCQFSRDVDNNTQRLDSIFILGANQHTINTTCTTLQAFFENFFQTQRPFKVSQPDRSEEENNHYLNGRVRLGFSYLRKKNRLV